MMRLNVKKISVIVIITMIIQIVNPIAISILSTNSFAVENATKTDSEYTKLYDNLCDIMEKKIGMIM